MYYEYLKSSADRVPLDVFSFPLITMSEYDPNAKQKIVEVRVFFDIRPSQINHSGTSWCQESGMAPYHTHDIVACLDVRQHPQIYKFHLGD